MNPLATSLLHWFDQYGRHDLPWQKHKTAYRVWISEVMLQQTQVNTVIPYFNRFIKRFPNIKNLATAPIDAVLSYWSGLGYYRRAHHLHHTAHIIHTQHGGRFPKALDALTQLPGIGPSTGGAILSLGMDLTAVILDGNVKRVLARYNAINTPLNQHATLKQLWDLAHSLTPKTRCAEYNQAIMDLGAMLCTKTQPQCQQCPIQQHCKAYQQHTPKQFPVKTKKRSRPHKQCHYLLIQNEADALLLEKRPPIGIWSSLWSFPEYQNNTPIQTFIQQQLDAQIIKTIPFKSRVHHFTHFKLTIHPILLKIIQNNTQVMDTASSYIWYQKHDTLPGGVPKPIQQLLQEWTEQHNQKKRE